MAWFKVDDRLHNHRKAIRAADAMALWVVAGSWCADHLTDGFVPDYVAARLMPDAQRMAERLVNVGLWTVDSQDGDDGWRFNDWDEYQPTRDEVEAKRDRDRQRKASQRRNGDGTYVPQDVHAESTRNPDGVTPSRPDPTRTQTSSSSRKRADRATRLPDGWTPADEPDLVKAVGGQRQADAQLDRFRDYWTAQPGQKGRKVDWQATWRNWLRRAAEDSRPRAGPDPPPRPSEPVYGTPEWEQRERDRQQHALRLIGEAG